MAGFADELEVRREVTWADFEQLLADKGERSVPRITYLDGVLELVTPSRGHEKQASWIGRLVDVYAIERGIELSAFGHWTLKDQLRRAGAEADECYILGEDPEEKLTRPHLAIEVQWSRKGIDKLEVYRRLGVGEVWFWEAGSIAVYVLRDDGYARAPRSACLPGLDLDLLCSCLDRPTMTAAMRDFRAALATAG
jgi:Uma2 family endonuclease